MTSFIYYSESTEYNILDSLDASCFAQINIISNNFAQFSG